MNALVLLIQFCHGLVNDDLLRQVDKILVDAGIPIEAVNKEDYALFISREFHKEVNKHSRDLFLQGNYFHAVFEVCKVYNLLVKEKAQTGKDGVPLMLKVWGGEKGVLKFL